MITIAVDAMGGDDAPGAVVEGALRSVDQDEDIRILLFGKAEAIEPLLAREYDKTRLEVINSSEIISNHDQPTAAIRRKTNSSMVMALDALKEKRADAFLSAGSTGAVLAGGIFKIGRITGIERPALAPLLPTSEDTPALLIDCGANVDCKPRYLCDFALMGDVYMREMLGISRPRVALINIGAEDEKGNELVKEAFSLLKELKLNFTGNIEARDLLTGCADVLVCDGFCGNIVLKNTEGVAKLLVDRMKNEFISDKRSKAGALLLKPAFKRLLKGLDYTDYGGAPLLGVKGVVIKAHGSSNARAFASAVKQAKKMAEAKISERISGAFHEG